MKCEPHRILPRMLSLRRINTPYPRIAEILGLTLAEVQEHIPLVCKQYNLRELTKEAIEALTQKVLDSPKSQTLRPLATLKQRECLKYYAQGMTYEDIAKALKLKNPQTVRNHVSQACKAIGITHAGRFRMQRVQDYFKEQGTRLSDLSPKAPNGCLNGDPCF
jgi:DNA-binding CsgD family transcriptional regulator